MKDGEKTKEQLIEELNEAQQQIAELEAGIKTPQANIILEALSDMMFRLSKDGIFLEYHAPNYSPLYVPPSEFLEKHLAEVLPPDVAMLTIEKVEETLSSGERQIYDYHLDMGEQGRLYFEASMVVAGDNEVLALVRDITERKRIEEKLRASESRWRSLVQNAPNILFEFDQDGIIQFINFVSVELTVEDIIGMSLFDFTPPDDHERVKGFIEQVHQTGEAITYDTLGLDGEWYSVRIGAIKQDGEISNLIMILTNITELKNSEIALRQSEERFVNYMENFPGGVFLKDENQRLLYCNTNYAKMMGGSPEAIIGKSTTEYIPYTDIDKRFHQQNQQVLQEGEPQIFENVYPTEDGESYWETVKFPIKYPDGSQQLGAITLNITERKLAEEQLKKSEARLRSFLNAFPDIAFIINYRERILDVLTSQESVLNLTIEELTRLSVSDILPPKLAQKLSSNIHHTLETQEVQSIELDLDVQAGHRWFEGRIAPMPSVAGEDALVILVVRDITERRETERKLSESEETIALKDRIISTVSHEFRTPLALIQTAGELLTRYKDRLSEERKAALFQQIRTQITVITDLIDDMLSINRVRSGKLELELAPLQLVSFCQSILEKVQVADTIGHRFDFIVSDITDNPLMLDSKLVNHIVTNLLTNAVKFSPEGSLIVIELSRDADNIRIKISDGGIGIPDEDQEFLFEPFRRADNVGTIRGTGLGLSIVKDYVDLLGGHIEVESEVGKGSTFIVTLPVIEEN